MKFPCFFSNSSHQRMIYLITKVSRSNTKRYKHQNKIRNWLWIHDCRLLTTDLSKFDKRWSDAHFVSFWYYYYCTQILLIKINYFFSQKYMFFVHFIYWKKRKNRLIMVKFFKSARGHSTTSWTKFYPLLTWFTDIYLIPI